VVALQTMAPKTRQASTIDSMLELEAGADGDDDDSSDDDDDEPLLARKERVLRNRADMESNFVEDEDDRDKESEGTTDEYSDDEEPAGAAPEAGKFAEAKEAAKSVAKREKMALARRVGETNKGDPIEFDPVRFGMYYSKINADLEISNWRRANEYMHQESYSFSTGYERGLQEENLHGQYQGCIRMPDNNKGCDAVKAHFKKFMEIGTHSGYKVQVKLMETTQTDEKMNAYVQKDRPKPWYIFDSKDVNGDPYSEEYNDFCRDKYKVTFTRAHSIVQLDWCQG
jgi:hypothetical protein